MRPVLIGQQFRPYEGYCYLCFRTPLVAVKENSRFYDFTGLCGRCYFQDPEGQDPSTWNEEPQDEA